MGLAPKNRPDGVVFPCSMSKALTKPLALTLALALLGCSAFDRAPDVAFQDKTCGTVTASRAPDPPVTRPDRAITGSASQPADGGLRVVINPIIKAGASVGAPTKDALEVQIGGKVITNFSVEAVSRSVPVQSDIVFVLDTTGSMFWAIDGMKKGVEAFADAVSALGIDARLGGIEFGDELRSQVRLTDTASFKAWVAKLGVTGGGDAPESPLDAIASAYRTMSFRKGAQRFFILITDTGMHESTDGVKCSETTTKAVVDLLGSRVFFSVVHAQLGGDIPGVSPMALTDALSGLYFGIDGGKVLLSFNVATDTPYTRLLKDTAVITIPASELPAGGAQSVSVAYKGSAAPPVNLPVER